MVATQRLHALFGQQLEPASLATAAEAALGLVATAAGDRLAILAPPEDRVLGLFQGQRESAGDGLTVLLAPLDTANARALRAALPNLRPVPLGLVPSAGCGDRLGLATPGHARAFAAVHAQPHRRKLAPIFAQQSIREMARTRRTPEDVMRDATWGAFRAGWRDPVGADADHLKTAEDVDACVAAGFTFFTFDPGAQVDSAADGDPPAVLASKLEALPWQALESSPADLRHQYASGSIDLGDRALALNEGALVRAAVKYGRALAHVRDLHRRLAAHAVPYEIEVSVDETETPTTHAEHVYFASELRRLGVPWVSLAPRYVGRFEKGIDYLGDLGALRVDLAGHAAIARALGPYKLSLHSGSDKFSVYSLIAELTDGQVHLKTAGTSYLEALRVLARHAPDLFRAIGALAVERYPSDRATYHVSAELTDWPDLSGWPEDRLESLLDQALPREILHVTFGSVLAVYGPQLMACLEAHRDDYAEVLERHFIRHLAPLAGVQRS